MNVMSKAALLVAALLCTGAMSSPADSQSQSFSLGNGVVATWLVSPYGRTLAISNTNPFPMVCEIMSADSRWVRLPVGPGGYVYMDNPQEPLRAGCYR